MDTTNTSPPVLSEERLIEPHDPLESPQTGTKRKRTSAKGAPRKHRSKETTIAQVPSEVRDASLTLKYADPIEDVQLRLNKTVVQPQEQSLFAHAKKMAKIQVPGSSSSGASFFEAPLEHSTAPIKVFSVAKIKPHIYDANGKLLSKHQSDAPTAEESIAANQRTQTPLFEPLSHTTEPQDSGSPVVESAPAMPSFETPSTEKSTPTAQNTATAVSVSAPIDAAPDVSLTSLDAPAELILEPQVSMDEPPKHASRGTSVQSTVRLAVSRTSSNKGMVRKAALERTASFLESLYDELAPPVAFFLKNTPKMVQGVSHLLAPTTILLACMWMFPALSFALLNSHPLINMIKLAIAWATCAFVWSLGVLLFLKTKSTLKSKIRLWNKKGASFIKHHDR